MQKICTHTFWSNALAGLLLIFLFFFASCRLEDSKLQVKVYPENGSTNVPVNTVIEIQYAYDLGVSVDQMKDELFTVHECEVNFFNYLMPQQNTPTQTNTDKTQSTENTKKNDSEKEKKESTDPEQSTKDGVKYLSKVNFFYEKNYDKEKRIIFNYLIPDVTGVSSPLKPATTYCVSVRKLKNPKNEVIPQKEISFTTEESPSFDFSSKINPEFHGEHLSIGLKNEVTGENQQDFILIYFRNQKVRPSELRSKIKLCAKSETSSTTTACKDFGTEVPSNIYLLEGLKNMDGLVLSNYNLFAITPRVKNLQSGQEFKIVIDLDLNKSEETNLGTVEHSFTTDSESSLNWHSEYMDQIKDSNGSVYTPQHRFFYIGSSS